MSDLLEKLEIARHHEVELEADYFSARRMLRHMPKDDKNYPELAQKVRELGMKHDQAQLEVRSLLGLVKEEF